MWIRRKVQKGNQIGQKIGFPTINLKVGDFKKYYSAGIYAAEVKVANKMYKGVLHFGYTLHYSINKLEIHILKFSKNIYGQFIQFRVDKKIRKPMRFADLDELKTQIEKDISKITLS